MEWNFILSLARYMLKKSFIICYTIKTSSAEVLTVQNLATTPTVLENLKSQISG
jgi:hypothetical protein